MLADHDATVLRPHFIGESISRLYSPRKHMRVGDLSVLKKRQIAYASVITKGLLRLFPAFVSCAVQHYWVPLFLHPSVRALFLSQ